MIKQFDIVRLKPGSKSFPFLGRTKQYLVRDVNGDNLRLAGQNAYMKASNFIKVDKDNG